MFFLGWRVPTYNIYLPLTGFLRSPAVYLLRISDADLVGADAITINKVIFSRLRDGKDMASLLTEYLVHG